MASKYLQKFPIPSGFQQILSDFTREVLRDQPTNIIEYAAKYFQMLEKGQRPEFNSKYNVKKNDKKYELAYNAKNAEDITKKASNITAKLNSGATPSAGTPAGSRQVIGTEKTVTGEETHNYVSGLTNKFGSQQGQQQAFRQAVSQTVDRLFVQIDNDKNGFLSSKQITNFIKDVISEMGDNVTFKEEDIQSFIDIVDNDKDGKISKPELIEFIMDLFNSM